jgi:glycerate kinase
MKTAKRILIASNAHRGVLGAVQACGAIARGLTGVDAELVIVPMADGGDGLIDALTATLGGQCELVAVHDPLFRLRQARMGSVTTSQGRTGIIEAAEAAGAALLPAHERQTMVASSYGVGELILAAMERGHRRIVVGLGGGITTDCGMGLAQALGVQFFDRQGRLMAPICNGGFNALSLLDVADISLAQLRFDPGKVEILVASDVDTPLLGPCGQARIFCPQKGANEAEIAYCEQGLANFSEVVRDRLGRQIDVPMGGAAGGAAAGLFGLFGAELRLGAELVAQELDLAGKIADSDLLVVGEGRLDHTTFHHKAPHYLAELARSCAVSVVAVVGAAEQGSDLFDAIYAEGLSGELDADDAASRLQRAASRLRSDLIEEGEILWA